MTIYETLKFIYTHPLNKGKYIQPIQRFIKWQILSRVYSQELVYPFIENLKFIVKKGMTGATGNIYCGLHDFEDMSFLLHFIKKDELFVDVGANIGSYTLLASGIKNANSISIEPIPETFTYLLSNVVINNLQQFNTSLNIGISDINGSLEFTKSLDTINHVAEINETNTITIPVMTLDEILKDKNPVFIKIDVEGFEKRVLEGSKNVLKKESLKAILIELNGSGARYGFSDEEIHQLLISFNFFPYTYEPFTRNLFEIKKWGNRNTLYLKQNSIPEILNIISNSKKLKIFNKNY